MQRNWKIALLACLMFTALPVLAQVSSSTGAIQGTVTDPGGAVIAGAKVVLINQATGGRTEGSTQEDGTYVFPLVPPGRYKIEVENAGFRKTVLSDLDVQITKVAVANAKMEIGPVTTEYVVTDAIQQVETTNASTGDVIAGNMVRNIPLATRNFLDLVSLQAGVAATMTNPAALGRGAPQLFVAGQRGTVNNFVLNGVDANNFGSNNLVNVPVPNPDAIREFRVSTSQYDATQGRGSGGNINVVQSSGGNEYHGNLFWFYRSDALNANDFFFNRTGTRKPALMQNQLGGTIGGPVPGLKETFWFFSYQAMRQKNGVAGAISGNHPVLPATRDAASLGAAFGVAPASIDPVALAWLNRPGPYGGQLFPSGTCAGVSGACGVGSTGLFTASSPSIFNEDQYSATFDRDLFRNNRFGYRMFYAKAAGTNPFGGGVVLGQGQANPVANTHMALTDTHIFSSNFINEFRAGFTLNRNVTAATEGTTLADIGMTRFNSSQYSGTPAVFFDTGVQSFGGISTNNDQASAGLTYTLGDTVSWTYGKHTTRFGAELRRYHVNLFNNFASRGFLSFPNFASFLTGTPNDVFVGTGITDRGYRAWDMSLFVQDDYRVMSRLTLNLGLRYDVMMPSIDIRDRLGNFDPSLITPACIAAGGGACLGAGFVSPEGLAGFGTPGVSRSTLLGNDMNNFGPRLGFAWDVMGNGKLSVRSGYGVYFIRTSNQTLLQLITATPFFQLFRTSGTGVIGNQALANPYPALPLSNAFPQLPPFPQFTGFNAAGTPLFSAALLTVNPFERTMRTPYNQSWNLTVQYEALKNWIIETGYIGSRGVQLLNSLQANSAHLVNAANPGLGGLAVNSSINVNARTMIPGFSATGLNTVTAAGDSWYNAFIFSVRHQMAHGFTVKGDYTFAKSLDTNSGAATQDLGSSGHNQLAFFLNKGLSNFDQKHRMVFTYLWEIPGPKQGWLGHVAGNWSVSGVTILQSGFPFSIVSTSAGNISGAGPATGRANTICNNGFTATGNASFLVNNFINASCFSAPAALAVGSTITGFDANLGPGSGTFIVGNQGTSTTGGVLFGNSGRNLARGPFQQRFDFSVVKTIPVKYVGEGGNLQFRAEFFKLFNTPIFNNPTANINSAAFGRIAATNDTTGRIIQFALKLNF